MKSAKLAAVLAALLVTAQTGTAADEATKTRKPVAVQAVADSALAPLSLSAIFAAAAAGQAEAQAAAPRGVLVGVPNVEVMVARIENGRVVTACVSSEKAAKAFMQERDAVEAPQGVK